ncbi:hypothetical protein RND81_14G178000 [Saponaria officinalis]|uniref:GAG-pre-integrase domain-containing protein n=1 Tax=Saponaria officinalis TaxID=3572 RepID=A0AAW1GPC7_SAPOF
MASTTSNSVYKDPLYLSPGDHSIVQLISTVFIGAGFSHWSRTLKLALISKNKLGFINGKCVKPASTDATYQDWIRTDYTVLRWILNSLSESIARSVSYADSSQQLWDELQERLNQTNGPLLYQLRKEMMQITQGDDTVAEYYSRLKSVWEDLKSMDGLPDCTCGSLSTCSCNLLKKIIDRDNKHMLIDFLMGLHKRFEGLRGQILAMDPLPTVNQAFSKVHQSELQQQITNSESVGDIDSIAMAVHKPVDYAPNFVKHSSASKSFSSSNVWKRDSKKPKLDSTGVSSSARGFSSSSGPKFAANVEEIQLFDDDTPCDIPASSSAPPQLDQMCKVFKANPPDFTSLSGMAVASTVSSSSFSSSHANWIIDSGASDHMTFDFTILLHIRNFILLLQFPSLMVRLNSIELHNVLYLPDFKHRLLSLGRLLTNSHLTATFTSFTSLIQAPSSDVVLCSGIRCAGIYQLHNTTASLSHANKCTSNSVDSVALLHARLGHLSIGALKHVVSLSDSHFNKNEFHCEACIFLAHSPHPFYMIHMDLWGPYRNGRVERKHRHLLEVARALRFHGNLPKRFWGELILTATHLINLTPTSVLKWQTPFEVLFHKPPDYSMLRIIGCLAYAHMKTDDKFEPRTVKCVMLSYPFAQKGYRLYDLTNHKIILSRHVIFKKHILPYVSTPPPRVVPSLSHPPWFPTSNCDVSHSEFITSVDSSTEPRESSVTTDVITPEISS